MTRVSHGRWWAAVFLPALATVFAATAAAATLVVTSLDDTSPNGLSSTVAVAAPGDVVTFAPGLSGTILIAVPPLVIDKDLTILGPGPGVISVAGSSGGWTRAMSVTAGNVAISGIQVLPNPGPERAGGGIFNHAALSLENMVFTGCATPGGANGGGIENYGVLWLHACEIDHCGASGGGGIYNGPGSRLEMISSTVAGNGSYAGYGGGIRSDSAVTVLVNSTLAGNWATFGAGIAVFAGTVSLTSCTITDNHTSGQISGTAGIELEGSVVATVLNTIIARNINDHFQESADAFGTFESRGFNLIGVAWEGSGFGAPGSGDRVGSQSAPLDPVLSTLGDHGGPTRTLVPLPGSPAIDQGTGAGLRVDQRGDARTYDHPSVANAPGGDGTDIGAVEDSAAVTGVGRSPAVADLRITSIVPNPTRGRSRVEYLLPQAAPVVLEVLGVDGRRVRALERGLRDAGRHPVAWDGADDHGVAQPAGVYLVRLAAPRGAAWRRLVMIR